MRGTSLLIGIVCALTASAQSLERDVIGSYGAFYYQAAAGSLSITVGELATATLTSASYTLTQGFQQPTDFSTNTLVRDPQIALHFFPNPAHSDLVCTGTDMQGFSFFFADAAGRAIAPPTVRFGDQVHFDVSGLAPGAYSITVLTGDQRLVAVERIIRQ